MIDVISVAETFARGLLFTSEHDLPSVQTQPTIEFTNVTGTIAGFRSPDYVQGISAAGYHLPFIAGDRVGGGHALD